MYDYKESQYRLRKAIGVLGVLLPVLLLATHGSLLHSMSHYYYTPATVFFISILFAFGLILIAYKGHPPVDKELISDDRATTLAGLSILIAVIVPAGSDGSLGPVPFQEHPYLFGHKADGFTNTVHLLTAGLFLVILGYMSYSKFVLSPWISDSRKNLYKWCGLIVWACVAILILILLAENTFNFDFNDYIPGHVFWFECIALWAFGLSWMLKGKVDEDIKSMLNG